jgi:alpha-beta hydrolase superfamily lysophospholipase
MKIIQYNIEVLFPDVMVFSSKVNEDDTSISMAEMGLNLAKEVEQHIYYNCYKSLERLSFIGHSMGGVIIRAALPHLKQFKKKMYSYMSLSSPHLGFIYGAGLVRK